MKMLIPILSLASLNAAALTIVQDQGRLEIEFMNLTEPYRVQLTQPLDCSEGSAKLTKTANKITISHSSGCDSGAVVKLQVNPDQSLNAVLGAGALELKNFSDFSNALGKVSASTRVGSAKVPEDLGFKKLSSWLVGRSFVRETGSGPEVTLKVKTGSLEIKR
jgi:hypothetical protein